MRSGFPIHLVSLTALALPLLALWGCAQAGVTRSGAPQQRVVRRTYAADLAALRQAILERFREVPETAAAPFKHMKVIDLQPPSYPPDWFSAWVDPGKFLDAYKEIPAARRSADLLIEEPTGDRYWPSEYKTSAGAVNFRCGFIIHFEQPAARSTEVQVYEKVPEVWVGERWALLHEGIGFGKVHDIRSVEPTVKDRLDMLDALNALAPAQ